MPYYIRLNPLHNVTLSLSPENFSKEKESERHKEF
jgi:hypothetical protein